MPSGILPAKCGGSWRKTEKPISKPVEKSRGGRPQSNSQAIGWLARENKLGIEKKGRFTTYALKEKS